MKKIKYIHIGIRNILFLLVISCAYAAAYGLTALIFRITGQPPGLVDHLLFGYVAMILMPVGRMLFTFILQRIPDGGEHLDFMHTKQLTNILDAMSKIAGGDFNTFVTPEDGRNPYGEVAASVNKMAKELGSIEKLRQDFISDVSHEIQSPLTSINGYASLLKREGISTDEITHYATIIETESKRLSKLSDNLLRLSVLESESAPMEIKAFRLDKQLESILLMLEPQWAAKNITPDVSLPLIMMTGNEDLLSQVWINLLHNAIKFTPENGGIRVILTANKDNVVCTISDNGIGISPEDQMHIFERFYKVDKARDRSLGGNGLGLSLVKKIVELHQGKITVKSEKGQGAEFMVTLPNHNPGKNNSKEELQP
ncbi:MAG TPA: two-component sensor histidine kinase [Firmicutes bacterium]|jgi:two-component system, OmpR family, phosphate regulon sensor histidine kinase PhoR|nr:two-component sensor histidine kinase [Bacillota bacterium]